MERGEVAIVSIQFVALALLVLLLGNYGNVTGKGVSYAQVDNVYWGTPSQTTALKAGGLNVESVNASTVSLYFSIPQGSSIASPITASRICIDPAANNTGQVRDYTNITINWDSKAKQNYIAIGPAGQPEGIGCSYTISFSDSLNQPVSWTAVVKVVPKNSTSG